MVGGDAASAPGSITRGKDSHSRQDALARGNSIHTSRAVLRLRLRGCTGDAIRRPGESRSPDLRTAAQHGGPAVNCHAVNCEGGRYCSRQVPTKDPHEVRFAQHNYVVQALSLKRTDYTFGVRVLPRRSWRDENLPDAHVLDPLLKVAPTDPVAISK